MQKKDKEKVLDEVWTTERVKAFLDLVIPAGEDPDFYLLHAAYKNMRLENFEEFLAFFRDAGKNFSAANAKGQTVLDIIRQHRRSEAYATSLEALINNQSACSI